MKIKNVFIFCIFTNIVSICKQDDVNWVNFIDSMKFSYGYREELLRNDPHWQLVQSLYNQKFNDYTISHINRIPKIIHQVWLGSPLPQKCKKMRETWIKQHPDWHYILWTEKEIAQLRLINKKKFSAAKNYGEKSDIARYEILYRFGGLYVDTDFECLKPFDILHTLCDFYSGLSYDTDCNVYNGLIGSVPNHPILKKCIEDIAHNKSKGTSAMDIIARTGPYLLTRSIFAAMEEYKHDIILFPVTYFYPWPNFNLAIESKKDTRRWIKPESFAIHHWHGSWGG